MANRLEILFDLLLEGEASGNCIPVSAGEAAAHLSGVLDEIFPDTDFHERRADNVFDDVLAARTIAAPADLVLRAVASLSPPGGGLVERLSRFLRFGPSSGGWQIMGGFAAASIALVVVFAPVEQSPVPSVFSPIQDPLAPSAPVVLMPQPAVPDNMGNTYEPGDGWGYRGETPDFSAISGVSAGAFDLHDDTGCDAGVGQYGMGHGGGQMNEATSSMSGTDDSDASPCDPETHPSSPEETFIPFDVLPADSTSGMAPY